MIFRSNEIVGDSSVAFGIVTRVLGMCMLERQFRRTHTQLCLIFFTAVMNVPSCQIHTLI